MAGGMGGESTTRADVGKVKSVNSSEAEGEV
jgi:hypothetical protein